MWTKTLCSLLLPLAASAAPLTWVEVAAPTPARQATLPLTFGQVFAPGHVPAGHTIMARYKGQPLALQANVKATHADGSVRHAVLSTILPALAPGETARLELASTAPAPAATPVPSPAKLLAADFQALLRIQLGDTQYSADAAQLLAQRPYKTWLSGPIAQEWQVSAPLSSADGRPHPHLSARFAIRTYGERTRVDLTLENNWAYEPAPQNFTYDAAIVINGRTVFSQQALPHYHHTRWRKVFWTDAEPQIRIRHDAAYLVATGAVPNYDRGVVPSPAALAKLQADWENAGHGPMSSPLLNPRMPSGGARPEIGLLPAWAALYILSMDEGARRITLGLGDLAGSWPIHYRDRRTDEALSIFDYPYARDKRIGSDSFNPITRKHEDLPACTAPAPCTTPYTPDSSHQPSLAYLPYLLTGDAYYLDELLFWANWNLLNLNPAYRSHAKGLLKPNEVRGQAWGLRTLAHAAYIAPDQHPLKSYFAHILRHNLDHYARLAASGSNQLGFIDHTGSPYAVVYPGPAGANTALAPWQDDFFTAVIGQVHDLGFSAAKPVLEWKARFPIGRMTAPGFCWIDGAAYSLTVRPSASAPYFDSFADAWRAAMPGKDGCHDEAGEMTGYASAPAGFPAHMQPALAAAAGTGLPGARAAWQRFISRKIKPDYAGQPQFAILPR